MEFIEFETVKGKRGRYLVRNQEGVELVLAAARRDAVIIFDPDKVEMDVTPTGGYRFFAKVEMALEGAPAPDLEGRGRSGDK
jgi:hypothetical protein